MIGVKKYCLRAYQKNIEAKGKCKNLAKKLFLNLKQVTWSVSLPNFSMIALMFLENHNPRLSRSSKSMVLKG